MTDEFDFEEEDRDPLAPAADIKDDPEPRNTNWLQIAGIAVLVLVLLCGGFFGIRALANSLTDEIPDSTEVAPVATVEVLAVNEPPAENQVVVTVEVPVETVVTRTVEVLVTQEVPVADQAAVDQAFQEGVAQSELERYGFTVLGQEGVYPFDAVLPAQFKVEQGVTEPGQSGLFISMVIINDQNQFVLGRISCDDNCDSLTFTNGATGETIDLTPLLKMVTASPGCPGLDYNIAVARGINCELGEVLMQSAYGLNFGFVPAGSVITVGFSDNEIFAVNSGVYMALTAETISGDVNIDGTPVLTPNIVVPSE